MRVTLLRLLKQNSKTLIFYYQLKYLHIFLIKILKWVNRNPEKLIEDMFEYLSQ